MRLTRDLYVLSGGNYSAGDYNALGNVYGITTKAGIILIDCGLPEVSLPIIEESLAFWEIQNRLITHVLITHAHVDHCGNARHYQELGAQIVAGEGDVEYLCKAGGFNRFHDTRFDQGTYHIFPPFTPDVVISQDMEIVFDGVKFRFIMIPGHTVGSIAIYVEMEGKRILFTGDSVYPMGINCEKVDLGWRGDPRYDNKAFINSMIKLSDTVECDMVLPGHGNLCVRNGSHVIWNAAKTATHLLNY